MAIVLVCGGRDFRDRLWLWEGLDMLHSMLNIRGIIEGGAEGADRFAQEWGKHNSLWVATVPAQWDRYGKSAGYQRNVQMLSANPDVVLAAPGGKGTAMMVDLARQKGTPVVLLTAMCPSPRTGD